MDYRSFVGGFMIIKIKLILIPKIQDGLLHHLYKSSTRKPKLLSFILTELWERNELLSIIKYERYKKTKQPLLCYGIWVLETKSYTIKNKI